mgnify:CR=1 FL=1
MVLLIALHLDHGLGHEAGIGLLQQLARPGHQQLDQPVDLHVLVGLVREALHERGLLRRLAPHLVTDLAFVVPLYDWWEGPFYGLGFKLYDALAARFGVPTDHLALATGSVALIYQLVQAYCDPGDEVVYPSPGFPIYESQIRASGAVPVAVTLKVALLLT